jgi:hypothetical protein
VGSSDSGDVVAEGERRCEDDAEDEDKDACRSEEEKGNMKRPSEEVGESWSCWLILGRVMAVEGEKREEEVLAS